LIFPTIQFAAFFALVLPISWLLMPRARLWKLFIIAASYVFYGYADWHFVFLLAGCTIWNQSMGVALGRPRLPERMRTLLLGLALAGDLGLLGWFKYYGFFASNFATLSAKFGLAAPLPLLQVALPVGISFYTFQAMSYVIDIRRGRSKPAGWLDFAVYASFFPHLIAGPIVRASELVPQFATPRDPTKIEAARAFELIVGGLLKKVVLADMIASKLVDPVFGSPNLHSRVDIIAAVYGYAIQIYCDFSAYSDMAIGLALLLGFQFPANDAAQRVSARYSRSAACVTRGIVGRSTKKGWQSRPERIPSTPIISPSHSSGSLSSHEQIPGLDPDGGQPVERRSQEAQVSGGDCHRSVPL